MPVKMTTAIPSDLTADKYTIVKRVPPYRELALGHR